MSLVKWGIGLSLVFLITVGAWLASYSFTPSTTSTERILFIPHGYGVRSIKSLLSEQGLIKDDVRFLVLAYLSGTAKRLRSGEYLIPPGLKPMQILRILEKGDVIRHKITIPEGLTIQQIASVLERKGWIDPLKFLRLTRNKEFIKSLGFDLDNLEGYLFPDTYSITRGEVDEEILITIMVKRFLQVWKDITANHATDLVRNQIVVLASIVEKETADQEERPLIARVFLNRLEKKMRLQSDPTVIYGIEDFSGNLTRNDLTRKSPYNTYFITGLPPGPICNPGKESIKAVLHPADAPFLYFVSKNDGTHHFSTTLAEHNRAVRKYQKKRIENKQKKNSLTGSPIQTSQPSGRK